ncbi:MAG: TldD/PmbA family protein [Pseudomonadota bacterium]
MPQALDALTKSLLTAALKAGADAADAKAVEATSTAVDVRGGVLEQAERSEGVEIGLRVFVGQRSVCVSASDTSERTIEEMALRAVAMAGEAPEDPHCGLADPDQLAQSWDSDALELFDQTPEPSAQALQEDAARAEAAALAVEGVTQSQSASAGYSAQTMYVAMTNGFEGGYARTSRGLSSVAIAGTGTSMERDYDGDSRVFQADLRTPEEIGQTAGLRAVARLGARKPPTGSYPVVFDERIASSLIGHLLGAINGAAVARGASFLRDALGKAVLPDGMSLIEDPHRPRASGSRPFDGEGLATARRVIVEDGVLLGWTVDLANARKLGVAPTGNGARGTGSAPSPGNWNIGLSQGEQSQADLLRDMGTGLLITSMIGSTINPNTGDYSRGASGMWVENGVAVHPINECTVAGNLKEMLRAVIPANDARPHLSRVVPSLMIPEMTLAGA